ncbi:Metal homeostatis protein BSD2 [Grifola frondosa]|uniref:Metal homeostatis protein BSD2 n=1 Tax=Grifola frondosa TaxID=5627 RepID=A0A1C7M5E7_GRIFR|nr:Metal homeostatis protein BSD2 [Grifola frondosa]
MPARYAPLPNPRCVLEADRELDDAFESDDYDEQGSESTPLTQGHTPTHLTPPPLAIPGAYDFERERAYDYPHQVRRQVRLQWRSQTTSAIPMVPFLPPLVPTEPPPVRSVGGGTDNDGVFANVMAKPVRAVTVTDESGEVHMVPEETQKESPPSYSEAQADAVPPYWETTIHAPAGLDLDADMIVDDLPTGSVMFFFATAFVSYFFQIVGFLMTYLLHTSHAAKYGSRAGLGLTLIQYGFAARAMQSGSSDDAILEDDASVFNSTITRGMSMEYESSSIEHNMMSNATFVEVGAVDFTSKDWMSLLLMTLGWFLLLSSIIGFYRVKRWEISIRSSSIAPATLTPEQRQRDREVRRTIGRAFGFTEFEEEAEADENEERRGEPVNEAEATLRRNLEAAGFI